MNLFLKPKRVSKIPASLTIRPATSEDVAGLVKLAQSLSIADGQRPFRLTKNVLLRDGFGENPAFSALVAEIDQEVAGYTLYFQGYDTGRASRGVYISDLYVDKAWRRQGIGRALMQGTATACKETGGEWMFWSVLKSNKNARKFYRKIGPELTDVIVCAIIGSNFQKLSNNSSQ